MGRWRRTTPPVSDIPRDLKKLLLTKETNIYTGEVDLVFNQRKCIHCGGIHTKFCPRISQIEYHKTGQLKRVVYLQDYDDSDILYLEDLMEDTETT